MTPNWWAPARHQSFTSNENLASDPANVLEVDEEITLRGIEQSQMWLIWDRDQSNLFSCLAYDEE